MTRSETVPVVAPLSAAAIERKSSQVLRDFAPDCLINPQSVPVIDVFEFYLSETFNFVSEVTEMAPRYEGLMDPVSRTVSVAPHVYEGAEAGDGRSRFTVGHESGHVVLHASQLRVSLVDLKSVQLARRADLEAFRDPEWQANWFSASLLMPAGMVRLIAAEAKDPVAAVSRTFQVSAVAAELRLVKLGLRN